MTTPSISDNQHKPQRLSPQEARLLELEQRRDVHLHTGCVLVFDGPAPSLEALTEHVGSRLALVPRYRRRVVAVPYRLGPPVWSDDPRLSLEHHVRRGALPARGESWELSRFVSALLCERLDHAKPLWELWLIEGLADGRFALVAKTHSALVDGGANRDLVSVLLDGAPQGFASAVRGAWAAAPLPTGAQLVRDSLLARVRRPGMGLESARALAARAREELDWHDARLLERLAGTPHSRLNGPVGPTRRFASLEVPLTRARKARERLGGTINDAVLTAVAGGVGRYLRLHGENTDGLVLRALVPLADAPRGRLRAAYVPLPVGIEDARRRHAEISRTLDGLRACGRALGAHELVTLEGFAPATILGQAARLQAHEHAFNLAVTNVPGPQRARFLLGRELRSVLPAMPLGTRQRLSIALVSYRGRLGFGLLADEDAFGDLDVMAGLLEESTAQLRKGSHAKRTRDAR